MKLQLSMEHDWSERTGNFRGVHVFSLLTVANISSPIQVYLVSADAYRWIGKSQLADFPVFQLSRYSPLKLEKILDNKENPTVKLSDVCQHNNRGGHGAVERFGGGNSGKRGSFGENQGAVKVPRIF